VLETVRWALARWPADPARISSGVSEHFGIRHPELFGVMWLGPYSLDFDMKWNPGSGSLAGRLGPPELAVTPEGSKAWDVFDMSWYLKQDPAKDTPFQACLFDQPKDGNHGAEYGWQDDPKGLAALRDARQPYCGMWGGAAISRTLNDGLRKMRWDRSLPAFSNCSLDNNPGNGDPDDGDPFGQINGYLFWQYDDIVEQKDRWELTVFLAPECPDQTCAVDITPRHCRLFRPAPGERFTWTNTALANGKAVQSDQVAADKWGLVTLKKAVVSKGKNRLVIAR
jgi:hypothetical protein